MASTPLSSGVNREAALKSRFPPPSSTQSPVPCASDYKCSVGLYKFVPRKVECSVVLGNQCCPCFVSILKLCKIIFLILEEGHTMRRLLRRMFEPEGNEIARGLGTLVVRSFTCCRPMASFHEFQLRCDEEQAERLKFWPKEHSEQRRRQSNKLSTNLQLAATCYRPRTNMKETFPPRHKTNASSLRMGRTRWFNFYLQYSSFCSFPFLGTSPIKINPIYRSIPTPHRIHSGVFCNP